MPSSMHAYRAASLLAMILIVSGALGCSNVKVVRLTSETFPPRSVEDVEALDREPTTEHIRIAELSATSTSSNEVDSLRKQILKKAAKLGAQAVVFSPPTTRRERRIAYQPMYRPGGYYAPYYYGPGPGGYMGFGFGTWPYGSYGAWGPYGMYGPWGPGWGYRQAIPYMVSVTTVKGLAIRYVGS